METDFRSRIEVLVPSAAATSYTNSYNVQHLNLIPITIGSISASNTAHTKTEGRKKPTDNSMTDFILE